MSTIANTVQDPNRYVPWEQITFGDVDTLSGNAKKYALDVITLYNATATEMTRRNQLENSLNEVNNHLQEKQEQLAATNIALINSEKKYTKIGSYWKKGCITVIVTFAILVILILGQELKWWNIFKF